MHTTPWSFRMACRHVLVDMIDAICKTNLISTNISTAISISYCFVSLSWAEGKEA